MPNHIINRVEFKGDDAQIKQIKALIGEKMDFNKIIPMPKELENTTSPVREPNSDENRELRKKYGFDNWYDWSISNWGTKWNAYETQPAVHSPALHTLTYEFQTAWSMPAGIAEELANRFPEVQITWKFADEDLGNNCGTKVYHDGGLVDDKEGDEAFANEMWGWHESDEEHDYYPSEDKIVIKKYAIADDTMFNVRYESGDWEFTGTKEEVLEEIAEHMENMILA